MEQSQKSKTPETENEIVNRLITMFPFMENDKDKLLMCITNDQVNLQKDNKEPDEKQKPNKSILHDYVYEQIIIDRNNVPHIYYKNKLNFIFTEKLELVGVIEIKENQSCGDKDCMEHDNCKFYFFDDIEIESEALRNKHIE